MYPNLKKKLEPFNDPRYPGSTKGRIIPGKDLKWAISESLSKEEVNNFYNAFGVK